MKNYLIISVIVLTFLGCTKEVIIQPENHEIAATIRRATNGNWFIMNDKGHKPIGVKSVEFDSEKITINYNFTYSKVNTFSVTPDETFSMEGITCGASVGLSKAVIYLSKVDSTGVNPIDPMTVSSGGNIWIYGMFSR